MVVCDHDVFCGLILILAGFEVESRHMDTIPCHRARGFSLCDINDENANERTGYGEVPSFINTPCPVRFGYENGERLEEVCR